MSVSTRVRSEDLAVVAEARGYSFVLAQSRKNGGLENSQKPMEAVFPALGGCITMVAGSQAPLKGVDLHDLRLEIEGEYTSDGFDVVRIRIRVRSSSSERELEDFFHHVESICPVGNSLKAGRGLEVIAE